MEGGCQILDELAEVHALISDVVEDGLVAVALILHVADLHVQSQTFGNLTALDHRGMLTGFGLFELLDVRLAGDTVDALDVIFRFQVGLLHLQLHQTSGKRYHADVVTGTGFNGYHVAFLQIQMVHVVVIAFAGMLELHLHEVCRICVPRHVSEPVVCV